MPTFDDFIEFMGELGYAVEATQVPTTTRDGRTLLFPGYQIVGGDRRPIPGTQTTSIAELQRIGFKLAQNKYINVPTAPFVIDRSTLPEYRELGQLEALLRIAYGDDSLTWDSTPVIENVTDAEVMEAITGKAVQAGMDASEADFIVDPEFVGLGGIGDQDVADPTVTDSTLELLRASTPWRGDVSSSRQAGTGYLGEGKVAPPLNVDAMLNDREYGYEGQPYPTMEEAEAFLAEQNEISPGLYDGYTIGQSPFSQQFYLMPPREQPKAQVAAPTQAVAQSIDQLIAAAFAKGDDVRAKELWDFKNQPTDYQNYDMALRFAESDADIAVLKQWLDIFTAASDPESEQRFGIDAGWQSKENIDPDTGQITHHVTKETGGYDPKVSQFINPYDPKVSQFINPNVQFAAQFPTSAAPPSIPSIDGRYILDNVPRAEHYSGMDEWFVDQEAKFPSPPDLTPSLQSEAEGAFFGGPTKPPPTDDKLGMDEWFIAQEAKKFPSATSPKPKPTTGYGEISSAGATAMMKALKGRPESRAEKLAKLAEYKKRNRRFQQASVAARYQPIGKGMGVR